MHGFTVEAIQPLFGFYCPDPPQNSVFPFNGGFTIPERPSYFYNIWITEFFSKFFDFLAGRVV